MLSYTDDMSMDRMGNGERGLSLAEEIQQDLQAVTQALRELSPMQPTLEEDIQMIQGEIARIHHDLMAWDENAERMREAGELSEDMPLSRDIGRAMNSLSESLENLVKDQEILLDTRMVLETAISDLKSDAEKLLAKFPTDNRQ